jgi:predicted adenine nucleotide alpha hydrolase (AANH) superfamily ATPase
MEKLNIAELQTFKASEELENQGFEGFTELADGEYFSKFNSIDVLTSTKTINGIETIDLKFKVGVDVFNKDGNPVAKNYSIIVNKYGREYYQKYVIDGIINLAFITKNENTKLLEISKDAEIYKQKVAGISFEIEDKETVKHFVRLPHDGYEQISKGINNIVLGLETLKVKGFTELKVKTSTTTAANGNTYSNKKFTFKIPGTSKTLITL